MMSCFLGDPLRGTKQDKPELTLFEPRRRKDLSETRSFVFLDDQNHLPSFATFAGLSGKDFFPF
jgi:hypothetical protein